MLHTKGAHELDRPGGKTRQQPRLPGNPLRIRGASRERNLLRRQHDEKHEGNQTRRVDPVGQRTGVAPTLATPELHRLPSVEQVSDEERDGDAWKDAPIDECGGEPKHSLTQGDQDQE